MNKLNVLVAVAAIATMLSVPTPALAMRDPGPGGAPPPTDQALYNYGPRRQPSQTPYAQPAMPPRIGRAGLNNQYADGMNLYQYVGSNPLVYVDPSGLLKDYECCTDAQKRTLQQDVDRASNTIIPNLVKSIDAAINADTGQYPLLTATKLGTAKRYLSCIDRELGSLGVKCEKAGMSRKCDKGDIYGWANWMFASRIHICNRVYFGMTPEWRSGALMHEASHKCGSLDVAYFLGSSPHDVVLTGWQDIADTYRYWATEGFCIPGHDCP